MMQEMSDEQREKYEKLMATMPLFRAKMDAGKIQYDDFLLHLSVKAHDMQLWIAILAGYYREVMEPAEQKKAKQWQEALAKISTAAESMLLDYVGKPDAPKE